MKPSVDEAFDTIESAHDFVTLLAERVAQAKRELELDVQRETVSGVPRRLDVLRIAQYSVGKLEIHVNRTSRILNDLRTMRRLLFEERSTTRSTNTGTTGKASSALPLPATRDATLQNVTAA